MIKTKQILVLAVVAAVSALALAVTSAAGDTNGSEAAGSADPADVTVPDASAPIQGVPRTLPEIAATQLQGVPGAAPAESVLALQAPVGSLYLTPTDEGACLSLVRVGLGAGLTCAPEEAGPATLLEGCAASAPGETPTCDRALIYGVVPAGVSEVRIGAKDGTTLAAGDTTNGVYLLDVGVGDGPTAVEFRHAGDRVRQPLPYVGLAR